jgi:hypothetical protein
METIRANLEQGIVSFSGFHIKTKIINGKEKKDIKQMPPWKQINKDNCLKYVGLNCAVICGAISGISVIDFDNMDTYNKVMIDFPELKDFKQVQTRNGVHIYGKYNKDLHTTTNAYEMYEGIDIRNDESVVFAPPTRYNLLDGSIIDYKDMGGELLDFPHDLIQKQKYIQKELIKKTKEQDKQQKKVQKIMENEPITDLDVICRKIINAGLLDDMCDDYNNWIKVGFAIYNSVNSFELFDLFSARSTKYDAISVKKHWDGLKPTIEDKLTFASILYWAKEKDIDIYATLNIVEKKILATINEMTFKQKSKLFEKTHCKIIYDGVYVHEENNLIKVISETDIRNRYKHIQCGFTSMGNPINFIERWISNNNDIRCKKTMGFYMKECPDDAYNLWSSFSMELIHEYIPKLESIELFRKHISILCNHEQSIINFVINWIAFMIQYPEKKSKMLVFVSDEGAGKNTLLEIIKRMIGSKKVFESTNPSRDVWGNFNGRMVDAFLVNLNEISALDFKNANGLVKGLITEPTITINEKGVKPFDIHSYHHFITSTNNEEAIKPSKNDRRNCLIRCSDELVKNNKTPEQKLIINAYLKDIYTMMDDQDSIKTIYEWLKSLPNLADFNNVEFPLTDFHKTQTELTISPIELWLRDFVVNHHGETEVEMSANDIYSCFKSWISHNMTNYECSLVQFGVRLTNFNKTFIINNHTKYGSIRVFKIPELHKLLFPNSNITP